MVSAHVCTVSGVLREPFAPSAKVHSVFILERHADASPFQMRWGTGSHVSSKWQARAAYEAQAMSPAAPPIGPPVPVPPVGEPVGDDALEHAIEKATTTQDHRFIVAF